MKAEKLAQDLRDRVVSELNELDGAIKEIRKDIAAGRNPQATLEYIIKTSSELIEGHATFIRKMAEENKVV